MFISNILMRVRLNSGMMWIKVELWDLALKRDWRKAGAKDGSEEALVRMIHRILISKTATYR
jgi:hypothetical protein